MIVVALQQGTGKVAALGVPRNLVKVPLRGRGRPLRTYDEPLYGFTLRTRHADLFAGGRDPARPRSTDARTVARPPNRLLRARRLRGFVEMVDALGGVYVVPNERYGTSLPPYAGEKWIPIDVWPGTRYHFDGREALAYARSRWPPATTRGCSASAACSARWPSSST